MADFDESKHPRAEDGKFTSGSGSSSTQSTGEKTYRQNASYGEIIAKSKEEDKHTAKKAKSDTRKDKYGNPLLSDEAFMVGVNAVNELLLDEAKFNGINKKEAHEQLKKSNVYADALEEAISDALYDAGYNDDFDITEQDFDEIIGYATGEEYRMSNDRYPSGFKRWTGKKYSGYKVEEN